MRIGPLIALAGALVALFATPAVAQTSKVLDDFSADGRIDPCRHSTADLRKVQDDMPPDIEQYAPDYPAAVAAAIEARARGDCLAVKPAQQATAAPAAVPTATPTASATPSAPATAAPTQTVVADPPAPAQAPAQLQTSGVPDAALARAASATAAGSAPLPVLVLAIVALLVALVAGFLAIAGRLGVAESARHACREAAWRAEGVWEAFVDWLRLGR